MTAANAGADWLWEPSGTPPAVGQGHREAFVACFATPAGQVVLDQLRQLFLNRRVPPTSSSAELRHVEGQRSVAAWIIAAASPPAGDQPTVPNLSPRWTSR